MRIPAFALSTTLLLGSTLAAAPAEAGGTLRIDVDSEDGDSLHLSLGTGLISGLVRAFAPVSLDCNGDNDNPRLRELFRELDRAGEPSRGTVDDGDDRFDARRRNGKLYLTVTDEEGQVSRIEMPWTLARCVLGGERISRGDLARALDEASFELKVEDGDGRVQIQID